MTDELKTWFPLLVTIAGILIVNRNARRANSTQMQNVDLARIRDLRAELAETKADSKETRDDLTECKRQAEELIAQLTEANQTATNLYMERQEMIRYASMPGVTIDMWLSRFGDEREQVAGR